MFCVRFQATSPAAPNSLSSVGNHSTGLEAKVRCPHCLRGFSSSAAPTHIAICAKVENRPKSAFAVRTQGRAGKGRSVSVGSARVKRNVRTALQWMVLSKNLRYTVFGAFRCFVCSGRSLGTLCMLCLVIPTNRCLSYTR